MADQVQVRIPFATLLKIALALLLCACIVSFGRPS